MLDAFTKYVLHTSITQYRVVVFDVIKLLDPYNKATASGYTLRVSHEDVGQFHFRCCYYIIIIFETSQAICRYDVHR